MASRSTSETEVLKIVGENAPATRHYRAPIPYPVSMVNWKPFERPSSRTIGECTSYEDTTDPATSSRPDQCG